MVLMMQLLSCHQRIREDINIYIWFIASSFLGLPQLPKLGTSEPCLIVISTHSLHSPCIPLSRPLSLIKSTCHFFSSPRAPATTQMIPRTPARSPCLHCLLIQVHSPSCLHWDHALKVDIQSCSFST